MMSISFDNNRIPPTEAGDVGGLNEDTIFGELGRGVPSVRWEHWAGVWVKALPDNG